MLILLKDILMWLVFALVLVLFISIGHTILVILGIALVAYAVFRACKFLILESHNSVNQQGGINMSVADETKRVLLNIYGRLPQDKAREFMNRIRIRLKDLDTDPILGYGLLGAAIGAVAEMLPPLNWLFELDHAVVDGAVIGGLVGFLKSRNQNGQDEKIRQVIKEELANVLA